MSEKKRKVFSGEFEVYRTASGGGAKIVDKFSEKKSSRTQTEVESGQRCFAASDALPS